MKKGFKKNIRGLSDKRGRDERLKLNFFKKIAVSTIFFAIAVPMGGLFINGSDRKGFNSLSWPTILGLGGAVYLMVIFLLYGGYSKRRRTRPYAEHGTSSIMTEKELPEFERYFFYDPVIVGDYIENLETKYDDMELKTVCTRGKGQWVRIKRDKGLYKRCFLNAQIMGQGIYLSMNCKFINRNLNTLTIGGSGQGKSYSELLPNALNANCNYVFTDPSGEILQKIGKFLEESGYRIRVFNVDDFSLSQKYNPLAYVSTEKDYNTLVDALNKNIKPDKKSGGQNEFFDDAKDSLICALVALLKELYPDEPRRQTLANVMELLRMATQEQGQNGMTTSVLDSMFSDLRQVNPRSYAARMWENFRVGGPKVCNEVIISAAAVFGRYFDTDDLAFLTSEDELHLEELAGEEKCALFLVIPQSTATYNFMVSMIYSQLFDIVMKKGKEWRERYQLSDPRLPRHLSFWLDEFANCGRIPNFLQLLSVVRKYNISINIIIQGMAQLKGMYPREEWESILANLDTMIYLGGMEPGTVKWLSEKLGKETIRQISASTGKGGSQNFSNTGRALMTADEIEQMSRSHELIFISGCKPIRTRKYDLSEHPNYEKCGEANTDNNFDVALHFKTERIDYEALETARIKAEDIRGYDFRRVRVKEGVQRGELPQKQSENRGSLNQSALTEDEKKRREEARKRAASDLNQNPEDILFRYDLSNADVYAGYRADYEFGEENERQEDMMGMLMERR